MLPLRAEALDAGHHLAPQSGHLHLEELVDPLAEEDEELDPLEQGHAVIGDQVEQPVVEVEVGELAGEVPGVSSRPPGRRSIGPGRFRCSRPNVSKGSMSRQSPGPAHGSIGPAG